MCRFPMWATKELDPVTGKFKIHFLQAVNKNDNVENMKGTVWKRGEELIQLPCGRCIECRLNNSKMWANRCMLETKEHKDNYFITLTYNNDNLPIGDAIDVETGELYEVGTLKPKDLQDFIKRLRITWKRKYNVDNIKFYACGEYGEKYERPHYHLIVFGLPIFDLIPDHKSKKGNMNFNSPEIAKIWNKGRIAVGSVTWDSCAYTARYILKKVKGNLSEEFYKVSGKIPEFVRMSRNPGIGKSYFDKHWKTIYETDEIFLNTSKGVQQIKPSRYYDKLFDVIDPEEFKRIRRERKENAELKDKMKYFDIVDKQEAFENECKSKDLKYKSLKRKFEKDGSY